MKMQVIELNGSINEGVRSLHGIYLDVQNMTEQEVSHFRKFASRCVVVATNDEESKIMGVGTAIETPWTCVQHLVDNDYDDRLLDNVGIGEEGFISISCEHDLVDAILFARPDQHSVYVICSS